MITSVNSSSTKDCCLIWEKHFCWSSSWSFDPQKAHGVWSPWFQQGHGGTDSSMTESWADWMFGCLGSKLRYICKRRVWSQFPTKALRSLLCWGLGIRNRWNLLTQVSLGQEMLHHSLWSVKALSKKKRTLELLKTLLKLWSGSFELVSFIS